MGTLKAIYMGCRNSSARNVLDARSLISRAVEGRVDEHAQRVRAAHLGSSERPSGQDQPLRQELWSQAEAGSSIGVARHGVKTLMHRAPTAARLSGPPIKGTLLEEARGRDNS